MTVKTVGHCVAVCCIGRLATRNTAVLLVCSAIEVSTMFYRDQSFFGFFARKIVKIGFRGLLLVLETLNRFCVRITPRI